MSHAGTRDVNDLSDTELLDALEQLIQHPEFINLELGYEAEVSKFYAGSEYGKNLRDLLRTVLSQNRPGNVTLDQLITGGKSTKADTISDADRDPHAYQIDAA
ncbi:MAG: hypothetical protein JOY54_04660 [Acidobacteriaceae bacterium]|nr:hypothetical protein [Acidobacteriaceae bacterium]